MYTKLFHTKWCHLSSTAELVGVETNPLATSSDMHSDPRAFAALHISLISPPDAKIVSLADCSALYSHCSRPVGTRRVSEKTKYFSSFRHFHDSFKLILQ